MGLFNNYSGIPPWLVDGGAKSGSGCWGTELNAGDMLYIQDVRVKEEVCSCFFFFVLLDALSFCIYIWFRRRGVGSWLLQKMLSLSLMGYRGHAFCWPAPIGPAVYRRHVIRFGRRSGYSPSSQCRPLNERFP